MSLSPLQKQMRARRAARWHLLLRLYELSGRNLNVHVSLAQLARDIGLEMPAAVAHSLFLRKAGLARPPSDLSMEPSLRFTKLGIQRVEESLESPARPRPELGALADTLLLSPGGLDEMRRTAECHKVRTLECLYWVYQMADAQIGVWVQIKDLSLLMGLSENTAEGYVFFLSAQGHLSYHEEGKVQLNAAGIYLLEEAMLHPDHRMPGFASARESRLWNDEQPHIQTPESSHE